MRHKTSLLVGLLGASFFVFVAGSFVLAYLVFLSPTMPVPPGGGLNPPSAAAASETPTPGSGVNLGERPSFEAGDPGGQGRVNILLLGIDQRDDEKGVPTRSDTMMVVSIDESRKRASMISLSRDMWVQIPGYADNRINVANFLGDATKVAGGGPALAAKTVEANFGLKIDYWARINFRGFEKIVDTLGGVDVNVDTAIRDDEYPTDDYETTSIFIPAGPQHMNGKVALQYARSRHSENDFGRSKRQQKLLVAIRDRAMQLDVLPKLPSLMGTLNNTVETNIPPTEFLRLARLAKDIGGDNINHLVIDDKLATPFKGEGGADLLMPKKAEIRKAIGELLADPVLKDENAKVEVVNGTSKTGLATRTGDFLSQQGFNVVKIATADRNDQKTTEIQLMSPDKKETAKLLAQSLGLPSQAVVTVKSASTSSPSAAAGVATDIRVVLGQDLKAIQ